MQCWDNDYVILNCESIFNRACSVAWLFEFHLESLERSWKSLNCTDMPAEYIYFSLSPLPECHVAVRKHHPCISHNWFLPAKNHLCPFHSSVIHLHNFAFILLPILTVSGFHSLWKIPRKWVKNVNTNLWRWHCNVKSRIWYQDEIQQCQDKCTKLTAQSQNGAMSLQIYRNNIHLSKRNHVIIH